MTDDKKPGALAQAGFRRDARSKTARRQIDSRGVLGPKGAIVSYRAAFRAATGRTLEQASKIVGKYPEYADARDIREAARAHQFVAMNVIDEKEERRIARLSLKQMIKGSTGRGGGLSGFFPGIFSEGRITDERRGPKPNPFDYPSGPEGGKMYHAALAAWKNGRPDRIAYPDGPKGGAAFEKDYAAWRAANGPQSLKARFLVAIGRRTGDEEYAVGETP